MEGAFRPEQLQPFGRKGTKHDPIVTNVSGRKILGQSLAEPCRTIYQCAADKIMRELMVRDAGETSCALSAGKNNEITILPALIVAGNIDFAALVHRGEFFESGFIADKQHFDGSSGSCVERNTNDPTS